MSKLKAVIFDMDGILLDSEPFWKAAEKHIFSSVGVDVCDNLSAITCTMTTRNVTEFWYKQSPWVGKSLKQVENEVIECVESLIADKGEPMAGVKEILNFFQNNRFKIGLATNSPARIIPVVLEKLGISNYFSATSSSEYELEGKPHPAVYISTATKLKVDPAQCIAFEDSLSGIIAANKANIKTVAVPATNEFSDKKFDISHLKLKRLTDFTYSHLRNLTHSI